MMSSCSSLRINTKPVRIATERNADQREDLPPSVVNDFTVLPPGPKSTSAYTHDSVAFDAKNGFVIDWLASERVQFQLFQHIWPKGPTSAAWLVRPCERIAWNSFGLLVTRLLVLRDGSSAEHCVVLV